MAGLQEIVNLLPNYWFIVFIQSIRILYLIRYQLHTYMFIQGGN